MGFPQQPCRLPFQRIEFRFSPRDGARCREEKYPDYPFSTRPVHLREVREAGLSARSIWQGTLNVQKHEIAIKLYAAVEDRQVHFHLLHKRDRTRVQQRMVDPDTEKSAVARMRR